MEISDLHVGTVVHFLDDESHDRKYKFSVIVGISNDYFQFATVYINSNINVGKINSPILVALQYEIDSKKYRQFLKWNSYIDCSDLKHRFKGSFLSDLNATGKIVGHLNEEDVHNVIDLICKAETTSPYYLRLYKIGQ